MVINSPCRTDKKELAIPGQTKTGKEFSNPLMADSLPKTISANVCTASTNLFWYTASTRTLDNGEIELNTTVDGHNRTITKAPIERHLKLADAEGISTLPTTKIFALLVLMGYVTDSDKLTFQKDESITREMHDRLGMATTTASSLEAEQRSGNIAKTQTKATSSRPSSPRTSTEGGPGCHFTKGDSPVQARSERVSNLPNKLPLEEGLILENELSSTKAVYHKAFITLNKRVNKLKTQLKQKRSIAVIHYLDEEEPSLDIEDSPKQGRMIEEINKDENVNLVSEKGEVHETAEPLKDYNDATLVETLMNIKRSTSKDKGKEIMQETELPKKTKKR
uniref:Uncharacterized protein n=1 Tax=Tanacetum cinerariifolium TaxID=118510 RepID=A0A6L2L1V9_TANCI|nr:hypothetical protein [Tanacetum cinerariifolium]